MRLSVANFQIYGLRPSNSLDGTVEWSVPFPNTIELGIASYLVPQLAIDIGIDFTCAPISGTAQQQTRFLNPTQSSIGHWAAMYEEWVSEFGRIQYPNQRILISRLHLHNSLARPNRPIELAAINTGGRDVIRNNCVFRWCNREERSLASDGGQLISKFIDIGINALHLQLDRGKEDIVQRPPNPNTEPSIFLQRGVDYPSEISGVLWSGWAGQARGWMAINGQLSVPAYLEDYRQNPAFPVVPIPNCGILTGPPTEFPV